MTRAVPENVGGALLIKAVARRPTLRLRRRSVDVLLRMCASAVDCEASGTTASGDYYGGWVPLLMALGYDPPAAGQPISDNAKQAVRRALRELVDAGLVEPLDDIEPRDYRDRAYRITL